MITTYTTFIIISYPLDHQLHAHTPIVLHQLFKDNATLYKGTVIFTSTQRGYSPCRGWFSPGTPYRTTVARKR